MSKFSNPDMLNISEVVLLVALKCENCSSRLPLHLPYPAKTEQTYLEIKTNYLIMQALKDDYLTFIIDSKHVLNAMRHTWFTIST